MKGQKWLTGRRIRLKGDSVLIVDDAHLVVGNGSEIAERVAQRVAVEHDVRKEIGRIGEDEHDLRFVAERRHPP